METRRIKMFVDGADLEHIRSFMRDPRVSGFTTNPTLMRKAGVADYRAFAHEALALVDPLPMSLEVFSDSLDDMLRQGEEIASWGQNVYVKIPITNTMGMSTAPVIRSLNASGIKVNVTAIMTLSQLYATVASLVNETPVVVSVFAGRIADAGVDPIPVMREAKRILSDYQATELLWASPREILNLVQAEMVGCDIITMTNDLWSRLSLLGKDLEEFSLDTVKMFHSDAKHAGYML